MRILLIGSTGVLGSYLLEKLSEKHEVKTANRSAGDFILDMSKIEEVKDLLRSEKFEAIVVAAGHAHFGALESMSTEHLKGSVQSKLFGQINLVLAGQHKLAPGSSITLISGILADDPIDKSSALAMVNGALNAFVKAAAMELIPKGIRLNVVSPGLVEDSAEELGDLFPGHVPVPMSRVYEGYRKSIEGNITGEVIRVF